MTHVAASSCPVLNTRAAHSWQTQCGAELPVIYTVWRIGSQCRQLATATERWRKQRLAFETRTQNTRNTQMQLARPICIDQHGLSMSMTQQQPAPLQQSSSQPQAAGRSQQHNPKGGGGAKISKQHFLNYSYFTILFLNAWPKLPRCKSAHGTHTFPIWRRPTQCSPGPPAQNTKAQTPGSCCYFSTGRKCIFAASTSR